MVLIFYTICGNLRHISHCFTGGGLTSYQNDPKALSEPLANCLKEAKRVVPYDSYTSTQVFLGATAGMRMLE